MPLLRGVVYSIRGAAAGSLGGMAFNNNEWNSSGLTLVGVLPLFKEPVGSKLMVEFQEGEQTLWLDPGRLISIQKATLMEDLFSVDPQVLAQAEDHFLDLVCASSLLRNPPTVPAVARRQPQTPGWGEIYWTGPPIAGETKRWLVISDDGFNVDRHSHLAVRTTTSTARGGPGFPEIQSGAAKACVGEATTKRTNTFDISRRPNPMRADIQDMRTVLNGVIDAYDLGAAAERVTPSGN